MLIIKRFLKVIWLLSLITLIFAFFGKDNLPSTDKINSKLSQSPLQSKIQKSDIKVKDGEFDYNITPKYNYELWGLVVSQHDSRSFIDLYHKRDPFNTKDVCVFWGENVKNGVYEKMKFSSGDWSCQFQFKDNTSQEWSKFDQSGGSNNHLLPSNNQIALKIKNTSIGDQVHMKGYLVEYTVSKDGQIVSKRGTSTVRTDTGNHSCEVIYVTDYEIVSKGNIFYHDLFKWSKYLLLITSIIIVVLFFATINKVEYES